MNTVENILFQVLHTLINSTEFSALFNELPDCMSKCIHYYIKEYFSGWSLNIRVPQELVEIFYRKNLKAYSFIDTLHALLFGLHEHTVYHCKLGENCCPYHQVFSLKYYSLYSCHCLPSVKQSEHTCFDFLLDVSSMQAIHELHKKTVVWKKYLSAYENQVMSLAYSQDCITPNCKFVPELKYRFVSSSKNILFSLKLARFPNFQENLRIFSMFPKVLDVTELSKSYEIFCYLLISPSSYGSLQYFKSYGSWGLIHGFEIKFSSFHELLEQIIDKSLVPIHVFYSETLSNFADFKDQKFYSLISRNNNVNNSEYAIDNFLGKRVFEENSNNFWVCTCNIVNFSENCSSCNKQKSRNSTWTCVCTKTSNKLVCACGKKIPVCSWCNQYFSWTNVFCFRCKGVIKNGKCKVCGLVQDTVICSKCISGIWRCKVCCYPNRDNVYCVRCSNPNKKKVILGDFMPGFIRLNFED